MKNEHMKRYPPRPTVNAEIFAQICSSEIKRSFPDFTNRYGNEKIIEIIKAFVLFDENSARLKMNHIIYCFLDGKNKSDVSFAEIVNSYFVSESSLLANQWIQENSINPPFKLNDIIQFHYSEPYLRALNHKNLQHGEQMIGRIFGIHLVSHNTPASFAVSTNLNITNRNFGVIVRFEDAWLAD